MTMDGEQVAAAIRSAVRQALDSDDETTIFDALTRVPAGSIGTFLHATFTADSERQLLCTALGASPGAASGDIVFNADDALAAAEAGRHVILVRNETSPDDVLGMQSSKGILTTRGGITSHAAVVARGWGIPAVVGAGEITIDAEGMHLGDQTFPAGTTISIDGRSGAVFLGGAKTATAEAPAELETLMQWADSVRTAATPPVLVRANADNAEDAAHARRMGAEGIGLCRTEHMFLADDRLPLVRRFILTDDPTEEAAALTDLEAAQQHDFEGILREMDGLPVTVRLLDPPLHEFLPDLERLVVAEALDTLDDEGRIELAAVRRLHEVNPMIGTRGVRLGVVKPGVYQMQVRSLLRAVRTVIQGGGKPMVEVMIPLVVDTAEMHLARQWVCEALTAVGGPEAVGTFDVGAMLETPRAAFVAGELATVSDFFSFGTNDLTQLTFAFSRDDVGSKLIPAYLSHGLLAADPFETLDQVGVGRMISYACDKAREAKPSIKIGVCGEQAGDPDSAKFLVACGVDYVSCSPYRVPIARLAVAQALIETGRATLDALVVTAEESEQELPIDADAAADEFLTLHAMRIKGFAGPDVLAEVCGLTQGGVEARLAEFADAALVRHIPARNLWQLTPSGKERHQELLAQAKAAPELAAVGEPYHVFLVSNVDFKDLCNRWQVRDGEANDHSDAAYDAERIGELRTLHHGVLPSLASFAGSIERFSHYADRLAAALTSIERGETKMFTGVMCGSYHDIWMELHEDLVQLLGVDRAAEGSF